MNVGVIFEILLLAFLGKVIVGKLKKYYGRKEFNVKY
jgi:hypothetical protein